MSVATYTLAQYVEDLRHISRDTRDPRAIVDRVRPLAQRLALDRSWLEPRFYEGTPSRASASTCFTRSRITSSPSSRWRGYPVAAPGLTIT